MSEADCKKWLACIRSTGVITIGAGLERALMLEC